MITIKQKKYLRGLAMPMEPIFQIGKDGINDNLVKQVDDALEARELFKLRVLQNSMETAAEAGIVLAERCGAELVQTIGHIIVLYRRSKKKPKIELPQ